MMQWSVLMHALLTCVPDPNVAAARRGAGLLACNRRCTVACSLSLSSSSPPWAPAFHLWHHISYFKGVDWAS
jgi:hypothetical protein